MATYRGKNKDKFFLFHTIYVKLLTSNSHTCISKQQRTNKKDKPVFTVHYFLKHKLLSFAP